MDLHHGPTHLGSVVLPALRFVASFVGGHTRKDTIPIIHLVISPIVLVVDPSQLIATEHDTDASYVRERSSRKEERFAFKYFVAVPIGLFARRPVLDELDRQDEQIDAQIERHCLTMDLLASPQ
jgi:hypothetical protein